MIHDDGVVVGLDLMGGDNAPKANIEGCLLALERGYGMVAYGSREAIEDLQSRAGGRLAAAEICSDCILPDEPPLLAIRERPDTTARRGIEDVREGRTHGFVSAGSTGALVAGGVLILGRARGVDKPCLGIVLPSKNPRGVLTLDLGASADARPQTLVQFAIMGDIYARRVLGWQEPKLCLLNIGEEPEKGSVTSRKAYSLLADAPLSFAGNIEARDVFSGTADIVVTDGFSGNILIKACEGTQEFLMDTIKAALAEEDIPDGLMESLGNIFSRAKRVLDYSAYGGAPLLGLNGCIVKCHGSSGAEAVLNGIVQARRFIENDVHNVISKSLTKSLVEGE